MPQYHPRDLFSDLGKSRDTADFINAGWVAIFQLLWDPDSALEKLCLLNDSFTDEIIFALAIALANNSKLRELDLDQNTHVTPVGWVALSAVLRQFSVGVSGFKKQFCQQGSGDFVCRSIVYTQ